MPAPCGLGKNSRRFGSAVGIGVTGPNLIRLADRPCRAADRPYEAPSHLKREGRAFGGGGTAHPDLGKARGDAFRRRSIGTLAGTAQVWLRQVGMRIALYQPDIPQNTGTILRLCGCLGVEAHIIEPAGFPSSDRAFRRAGMEYVDAVAINRHASWSDFDAWRRRAACRVVLFTTKANMSYLDFNFALGDVLLFGRESAGVPEAIHAAADARLRIPMRPGMRSLNVAMAVALGAGEALRQTGAMNRSSGIDSAAND